MNLVEQTTTAPMLEIKPPANPDGWCILHADGRFEHGPAYRPDEAAQLFWETVTRLAQTVAPKSA